MIDLDALAGLRAVATHGSVVAAAGATGFTPSAISQQVKRLERQTGVPLLERVGRGVMLTSHGQHLVDAGERVLADLEQARGRAAAARRRGRRPGPARGLLDRDARPDRADRAGPARRPPRPRA
ncbi:LysR family transcriptional regulator [Nocardioides convexus]|uniref:helix-turn-helix domain-containing protein n=1 Tax=Nocardioides convexus TaxID=2712224 RepID=UPI0024182C18|nr:LysR family transcriptional regulator [Nocardioides convexus]